MIKKKQIYSEFVEKEILKPNDNIKNYKFEFFLIYDNMPIRDVDSIIEKDLTLLINKGYIEDKIKMKVIYLMPNIGSFNLNLIKKDIKKLQEENNIQKNEINLINLKYQKDIKNLQEENKAQKNEINATNMKYQALYDENKNLKNVVENLFNEVNNLKEKLNIKA